MVTRRTFFDLNLKITKLSGVWIPDQGEDLLRKCLYYVYNAILLGYTVVFDLPMEAWAFKYSYRNIEELMKNVGHAVTHFLAFVKICVWLRRRKEILEIMDILEAKFSDYEPLNDFQPKNIIKEEKNSKDRLTKMLLFLGCAVSVTQIISSTWALLTDYEKYEEIILLPDNTTAYRYNQKVPYYMVMPWIYNTSKMNYLIALVLNCFPTFHYAWIIVGFDTTFTALLSCVTAHFRILQGAIKTIRPRCLHALKMEGTLVLHDSSQLSAAMTAEMNKCIRHLQLLFRICQKTEDIYTYLALAQALSSQIIICACLCMVSAVPITSKAFTTELDFLVAVEMEIALYCFFGNKVTITADNIPLALYEGEWLSAEESFKKSMLITMARFQKPIYLTIGKFSPLTLATFVSIGRASYSFFAVIKNKNS